MQSTHSFRAETRKCARFTATASRVDYATFRTTPEKGFSFITTERALRWGHCCSINYTAATTTTTKTATDTITVRFGMFVCVTGRLLVGGTGPPRPRRHFQSLLDRSRHCLAIYLDWSVRHYTCLVLKWATSVHTSAKRSDPALTSENTYRLLARPLPLHADRKKSQLDVLRRFRWRAG